MPRRKTKKTRLVFCEGAHDKTFLSCLKTCFKSDRVNVDIKRGTGGDQRHLVEEAYKKGQPYDQTYVKLDGDRPKVEMAAAEELSVVLGVGVLRSAPCIERLLIAILEPGKRIASWGPKKLKRYFQDTYIPEAKRTDVRAYESLFTKAVLNEAKERLPELRELVELF